MVAPLLLTHQLKLDELSIIAGANFSPFSFLPLSVHSVSTFLCMLTEGRNLGILVHRTDDWFSSSKFSYATFVSSFSSANEVLEMVVLLAPETYSRMSLRR